MVDKHQWSREDEIIALDVYFRVSAPQAAHPEVVRAAELVACSPESMQRRLMSIRRLAGESADGVLPLQLQRDVWNEFGRDPRRRRQAALRIIKERRPPPPRVSRREVRQAAMRVMYAAHMQNITAAAALELLRRPQTDTRSRTVFADLLLRTIVECVDARAVELVALVTAAGGRRPELISEVERAVIFVAAAELLSCPQTGSQVIINEAVEIVKQTGAVGGHKIVNGVLDAVATKIGKPAHA